MASKRLNKVLFALLFLPFAAWTQEQADTVAAADFPEYIHTFPRSESFFGLEAGVDIAGSRSAYHFGFSGVRMEQSCVLGMVSSGTSAGVSFIPETGTTGVYVQRWLTIAILDLGLKAGYETNLRSRWAVLQPQVGLGIGMIRITYNYTIPFFFGSRTGVPRSTLGIAYTFPWERPHDRGNSGD